MQSEVYSQRVHTSRKLTSHLFCKQIQGWCVGLGIFSLIFRGVPRGLDCFSGGSLSLSSGVASIESAFRFTCTHTVQEIRLKNFCPRKLLHHFYYSSALFTCPCATYANQD